VQLALDDPSPQLVRHTQIGGPLTAEWPKGGV
jgi:hypothetical protein